MTRFRIATWNLESFARPDPERGWGPRTPEEYEAKREVLAETLFRLNPDVVALQELGGGEDEALEDLRQAVNRRFGRNELDHRALAPADARGIAVGFLSKRYLRAVRVVDELPDPPFDRIGTLDPQASFDRFPRPGLEIRVRAPQPSRLDDVTLINVHLKSKLLTFPPGFRGGSPFVPRDEETRARAGALAILRRSTEALAVRQRATRFLGGREGRALVVLGDLNDLPTAHTSLLLLGPPGSQPGPIETSRDGGRAFQTPDRGDLQRLFQLGLRIPEDRRFSRIHEGVPELVDQILVSEALVPRGGDGRRVLPLVDSLVGYHGRLPSLGHDPRVRRGEEGSDHAPVIATFDL